MAGRAAGFRAIVGATLTIAFAALTASALATACSEEKPSAQADDGGGADAGGQPDGAADAAPVPKGDRVLGLGLDLSSPAFFSHLQLARDAGASTTNLSFSWDRLERPVGDAGADADADAGPVVLYEPALHAVNLMLPDQGVSVALGAYAIEADGPHLPVDLAGKALDDEAVLSRYEALSDYLFGQLVDTDVQVLLVGDAVDRALGDDAAGWSRLATLVGRASARARAKRPKVKVGFTVSAATLASKSALVAPAIAAADVVALTYVAVDDASRARDPAAVAADLGAAAAAAPDGKPIVLRVVGYPSSEACGGSEAAQAAFVSAAFTAWDRAASRVGTLTFWGLDDADDARAAFEAAQAGRSGDAGIAAFASLGFRTGGGRNKPALGVFRAESRARGF